jgi:hypothetical protein
MKAQYCSLSLTVLALVAGSTIYGVESDMRAGPNTSLPEIHFAETVYDFEKVQCGVTVRHDFIFTNTGKALLEISNVQTSCGCTTAGAWSRQIQPGETGIIPIQFQTSSYGGAVVKTVTVTCNDPDHRASALQIKGTVWKPIDVIPQLAVFDLPSDTTTNVTKVLRIINNQEIPVTLSAPESDNPAFAAELKTIRPGVEFQLVIKALPPFTAGNTRSVISLRTSLTNEMVITASAFVIAQRARQSAVPALTTNHSISGQN